jgi:uncharacterized protein YpiB (UPF0302 family)
MEKVVFIDIGVEHTPLGLYFTDHHTEKRCKAYLGSRVTDNMESVYYDLRDLAEDQKIFIRFDLKFNIEDRIRFISVIEPNPHLPQKYSFATGAEAFLHSTRLHYQKKDLEKQVDKALDDGDKELFMELTKLLKQVTEMLDQFSEECGIKLIKDKDKHSVKGGA